jgi:CDP-diacylglycerol--serine O-phosphatidyltransferase
MKKPFIGFYNYTVVLTYASLLSAIFGIICAANSRLELAVGCVLFSGVCDAFDGAVARTKKDRTEDEKNFGIQLDSICDVVAFGVTPALISYFSGVNKGFGVALICFYVLCALIRLSFFNVLEIKRQKTEGESARFYRGLPVTSISIILPVTYVFKSFISMQAFVTVLHIVLFAVGLFFILDFKMKKISFDKLLNHKEEEKQEEDVITVYNENK